MQTITVKQLSMIMGLIVLIGSGGITIGRLMSQVDNNKEDLTEICNRLETIEKKVNFIYQQELKKKTFKSPLVQSR